MSHLKTVHRYLVLNVTVLKLQGLTSGVMIYYRIDMIGFVSVLLYGDVLQYVTILSDMLYLFASALHTQSEATCRFQNGMWSIPKFVL